MNGRTNSNNTSGDGLDIPLSPVTDVAINEANGQVLLKWTDPKNKYATDLGDTSDTGDQLISEWNKTVVTRKTGSYPTTPTDGTVATVSSVHNQYQASDFSDNNLTNGTSYHYSIFAINSNNVPSAPYQFIATPTAGVALSSIDEGTILKINENGTPVEYYLCKHNYESELNGTGRELLLRKIASDAKAMSSEYTSPSFFGYNVYQWLNGTYYDPDSGFGNPTGSECFLDRYDAKVNALITPIKIKFHHLVNYGTRTFRAFILSMVEYGLSYSYSLMDAIETDGSTLPVADIIQYCNVPNTSYNGTWTRTYFDQREDTGIIILSNTNRTHHSKQDNVNWIRPAITLPSNAFVDSSTMLITGDTI